ncbi:MAG: response regulator [Bradymonadaceae bacterium]|nr:response regulator [Lujinxingiaceae bacterium]
MPHGHCYLWKPAIVWLQVITNGLIGLSYLLITATLSYIVFRIQDIPFRAMFIAFGLFIVTCGLTHFFSIYVIWNPAYWIDTGLRAVTAVASVGTAILMFPLIPKALALAQGAKAAHSRGIRLETMVEELEAAYAKTRALDELKSQFFANISHELRTPLTLIIGPAEELLSAENLNERQRRDLAVITRNARTLLRHVNDLLDVATFEAGQMRVDYQHVDVTRLVRLTAAHFEVLAQEKRLRFVVESPERLIADVDVNKIQRITFNLLSNAFKFTPDGGVVRISLSVDDDAPGRFRLEVADSGPGIRIEDRQRVFKRFEQLDGSTTRRMGGTGIGLVIVKDFVELHAGQISVSDAAEGGALFSATMASEAPEGALVSDAAVEIGDTLAPVDLAKPATPPDHEAAAAPPVGQPTVLVIEDNADMNRFIVEALSEFHVESAHDGLEGFDKAVKLKPDLIVSDVMMPGLGGDQLLRALRKREDMDDVQIVILTAKADDELRIELLRDGAQDYLMKPFSAEELRIRLRNLISIKRARDTLRQDLQIQSRDLEELAMEIASSKSQLHAAMDSMRVARDHAEGASQLKSDFLSMVSHELRSPLTAFQLYIELLRQHTEALPEEYGQLISRMHAAASRLTDLVEGLLHQASIERGQLQAQIERFDGCAVVEESVERLRPLAQQKQLALKFSCAPEVPLMRSDSGLLRLIASNLLANAIKFTAKGEVVVSLDYQAGQFIVAVQDTGPGIALEDQARIFLPFEHLEPMRHKHTPGVGLGLTLVRAMVNALGGTIEVDSEIGRGSVFRAIIPQSPDS